MIRLTSLLEAVELLPNGSLWIPNVEEITPSQWERINRIMVNKGYAMRGGEDCKQMVQKYLQNPNNEKENVIRKDVYGMWVDTIAMVLHLNPVKPTEGPSYNCRNVLRAALRAFGETQNIREAGYIFPGGKLLSLTGNFNQRDLDHTEINSVYSKLKIKIPPDETNSNHNVMFAFMRDCRVIRIGGSQPQADMFHEPTRQQAQRLIEFITEHNGEMMIICRSTTLGAKDHYYKRGTSPGQILRDIVYFYKTGKFLTPET
jgi:hypothetical protein